MLLLIRNELHRMLATKWNALILLVFSYACGTGLSLAKAYKMTSLEFGLYILANHYYLLYFFLISYLALIIRGIKQLQPHELIRYKYKKNFMLVKTLTIIAYTSILVFAQWLIAIIVGVINLPTNSKFSAIPISGIASDTANFFFKFKEVFSSPLWATLSICIYLIIGLSTLAMIIWVISLKFSNKVAIITVIGIIVNVMVGFKTELSEFAYPLFINKYLIFHHTQFQHGWFAVGLLLLIQALIFGFILIKRRHHNKTILLFDRFINNKGNYLIVIVFLLGYYILRLVSFKVSGEDSSYFYYLSTLYMGIPENSVNLKELLAYIIYMGAPIYLLAKFQEFTKSYQSAPWMIRHRNKKECNYGIFRAGAKFIIIYFLIGLVISLLTATFVTGKSSGDLLQLLGTDSTELLILLLVSQLVRLIELFMVYGIFNLFMRLTGQSTLSYMASMFGYIILFFMPGLSKYYPFGISSIIRLVSLFGNGLMVLLGIVSIYGLLVILLNIINVNIGGKKSWKK